MIRPRSIAALLCAAALSACSKDSVQNISAPATGADIKFFNFGVNAPGVNFYANDTLKLTATSIATCTPSTDPKCATTGIESTTGTVYAGAGNAGLYSQIAPGQYTFTGKIAAATDKGVSIASLPMTLADGKSYSFYVSGFYNTATKTAESFVVEDPFASKIDFTVAYVRFVNASSNSSPMTLYVTNPATGGGGGLVQGRRRLHGAAGGGVRSADARHRVGDERDHPHDRLVRRWKGLHRERGR
jgi:hypothetical protein